MSLQKKVFGLVMLAFLAYGAMSAAVQGWFILPSFYTLEHDEALKNMDRAVQAIERENQLLTISATDWSVWDDTYQFAQDQNEQYREANLSAIALDGLKVNLLYIFDVNQQPVWGMLYDLESQEEMAMPGLAEQLAAIRVTAPESKAEGVLITASGPMLISAMPILTSERQGPVMGVFVLGRFLDPANIADQARIELNAFVLDREKPDPETAGILTEMGAPGETLIRRNGDVNRVYQVLPDLEGKPALLLRVDVPRAISARGERSVGFALFSLLGAGLVILVVLMIGLGHMVLNPLKRLTRHMVTVGQNDQLYAPLALKRQDEIGVLGQEFDRMVERLAAARKSLIEQSYHSGMAQVATGILHNVGNVLNSVNVSCTLLMDQLRESRVGNVSKVAGLMAEPEGGLGRFLTEDPRGRQIPAYLASLAAALQEEQQLMFRETEALRSRIEHIKGIVAMQQEFSRLSGVKESIPPEQLMEDAYRINADDLAQHGITVQREYQSAPPVTVERHKVLQILLNLISNAKYACADGGGQEKTVTLRIFASGPDRVSLQVADNGIGILPENLTRVFQYGFTTRKAGHGFGLHSGALAARELGGRLTAHSDGPQLGATFTLELPCLPGDGK